MDKGHITLIALVIVELVIIFYGANKMESNLNTIYTKMERLETEIGQLNNDTMLDEVHEIMEIIEESYPR